MDYASNLEHWTQITWKWLHLTTKALMPYSINIHRLPGGFSWAVSESEGLSIWHWIPDNLPSRALPVFAFLDDAFRHSQWPVTRQVTCGLLVLFEEILASSDGIVTSCLGSAGQILGGFVLCHLSTTCCPWASPILMLSIPTLHQAAHCDGSVCPSRPPEPMKESLMFHA